MRQSARPGGFSDFGRVSFKPIFPWEERAWLASIAKGASTGTTDPMIRRLTEKTWVASRKESRIARTVVLKLKTAQFQVLTRSQNPLSPLGSCEELTQIALSLRDKVSLDPKQRFRLAGVGLSNFCDPRGDTEGSLFG